VPPTMRARSPVTIAQSTNSGGPARADQMTADFELDSTLAESFVANPAFLAASLTGFALIALDVFGPSAHLLAIIDNGERLHSERGSQLISLSIAVASECRTVSLQERTIGP